MSKFKTLATLSAVTGGMLLLAAIAISNTNIQPVFAQVFDEGASVFAPGKIIGPDSPGETDEAAPGQIIGPDSPGETDENSAGQKGLELGIIGSGKKTIP